MRMTVTFEPMPGIAISAEIDTPDNCDRLSPMPTANAVGAFRSLVNECVDKAMELEFVK